MAKRYVFSICLSFIVLFSLILTACGETVPTSTSAPTSTSVATTSAPTIAASAAPFPATTVVATATTRVATTAPTTVVVPTTVAVATSVPATTPAAQNLNSPVEFVRKYDTTTTRIYPTGVAIDKQGNAFVVDFQTQAKIYKYDPNGKIVTSWGKTGKGDGEFIFDPGRSNPLDPKGGALLAVDSKGNVYVADAYNHRVQKFDPNGTLLTKWGNEGSGDGQFKGAGGIFIDNQDNVYVAEFQGTRVQKFDTSGKFLLKFGSEGKDDGQFGLSGLGSMTVDSKGNIYITDPGKHLVQKFDPNGKFLSKFGGFGDEDGEFNSTGGITIDAQDNLYVADETPRVQKFDSNGKFLAKFTGFGDTNFEIVIGLANDSKGNIYVINHPGGYIYQFRPK